jgi:hypothetical protein
MGMLLPLGIEKGKEFKPDAATVALLKAAAAEAHAWLMEKAATDVTPWWSGSQWVLPSPPITEPTGFKWQMPNYFGVDASHRSLAVFLPVAKLGTGSFYYGSFHDGSGNPLEGGINYASRSVNVPVPALVGHGLQPGNVEFLSTAAPHLVARQGITRNADGTVDIYFGPKPPVRSPTVLHRRRSEVVPVVPSVCSQKWSSTRASGCRTSSYK